MNKHLTPQKHRFHPVISNKRANGWVQSVLNPLGIAVFTVLLLSSCVKSGQGTGADGSAKIDEKSEMMDKSSGMKGEAIDSKMAKDSMKKMEKDEVPGKESPVEQDDAKDLALQAAKDHDALFAESRYPSAATCGTCHPKHYKEWAVSSHSYAQLSPVYMSLNSEIN